MYPFSRGEVYWGASDHEVPRSGSRLDAPRENRLAPIRLLPVCLRGSKQSRPISPRCCRTDVEMPPGPLARVAGAALPVACGKFRCLVLPMGHPRMELVLRPFALLEPDIGGLPSVPGPHGPLGEPCRHACPSIHIAPPGRSLLSGRILPFGGQGHKQCRSATHHK
jgi:hypothetical protein